MTADVWCSPVLNVMLVLCSCEGCGARGYAAAGPCTQQWRAPACQRSRGCITRAAGWGRSSATSAVTSPVPLWQQLQRSQQLTVLLLPTAAPGLAAAPFDEAAVALCTAYLRQCHSRPKRGLVCQSLADLPIRCTSGYIVVGSWGICLQVAHCSKFYIEVVRWQQ